MRLDEYPIDDLHQCALGEFNQDEEAQRLLNETYTTIQTTYIAVLLELRAERDNERKVAL